MAIRIQRNTQAPAEFAGRAASPTMRQSGTTLSMQQQAIAAEGAVTKLAFNGAMAVAGGLAAGMSGQTTKDLGNIAAQGTEAQDASGFQVGKFVDETISTLGGVEGLMEGVEKQNVAVNMVNDYQKGVAIGQAHVKQQSESVIMSASGESEASFKGDMAKGNLKGAVDRAWESHKSSLLKSMNNENTTPAVRENIQAYMQNPASEAAFKAKYVPKEANAIAQRTASNANAVRKVSIDSGDMDALIQKHESQEANNEVFLTPEQKESEIHQCLINNLQSNAVDSSKTPRELGDYQKELQKRDDISKEEKSMLIKKAQGQKTSNANVYLDGLVQLRFNPQIDTLLEDAVDEGYFDSKKDAQDWKEKHIAENMPPIKNIENVISTELSKIDLLATDELKIAAVAELKHKLKGMGTVGQDAITSSMIGKYEKNIISGTGTSSPEAKDIYGTYEEDVKKTLDNLMVEVDDGSSFIGINFNDPNLGEGDVAYDEYRSEAVKAYGDIQKTTAQMVSQGKTLDARKFHKEAFVEWQNNYSGSVWAKDVIARSKARQDAKMKQKGTFTEKAEIEELEVAKAENRKAMAANIKKQNEIISKQNELAEQAKKTDIFTIHTAKAISSKVAPKIESMIRTINKSTKEDLQANNKRVEEYIPNAYDEFMESAITGTIETANDVIDAVTPTLKDLGSKAAIKFLDLLEFGLGEQPTTVRTPNQMISDKLKEIKKEYEESK